MAKTKVAKSKTTAKPRSSKKENSTYEQKLTTVPGGKLNNFLNNFPDKIISYRPSKRDYLILFVAGILLLAFYKKSLFVAAMVNGAPVTNLELQMKLNDQFRSQTLTQIINEKVILDEARKNSVLPTESEIDQKIAELEANVGGAEVLDNLLTQQGQTRVTLREQIRVQIAITKLYEKEATVSAEEVSKYIQDNAQMLQATDSASQEKEAADAIKQQKLSQIFSQKFQELKEKANIKIF